MKVPSLSWPGLCLPLPSSPSTPSGPWTPAERAWFLLYIQRNHDTHTNSSNHLSPYPAWQGLSFLYLLRNVILKLFSGITHQRTERHTFCSRPVWPYWLQAWKSFFFHIVLASEDTHPSSAAVKSQTVVFILHSSFLVRRQVPSFTHMLSHFKQKRRIWVVVGVQYKKSRKHHLKQQIHPRFQWKTTKLSSLRERWQVGQETGLRKKWKLAYRQGTLHAHRFTGEESEKRHWWNLGEFRLNQTFDAHKWQQNGPVMSEKRGSARPWGKPLPSCLWEQTYSNSIRSCLCLWQG